MNFNIFILDTCIFEAIMQRQWARVGDALAIHWLWQPLVVFILASHAASMFTFGPQSETLKLLTMYAFAAVGTLSRFVVLKVLQVRTMANGGRASCGISFSNGTWQQRHQSFISRCHDAWCWHMYVWYSACDHHIFKD